MIDEVLQKLDVIVWQADATTLIPGFVGGRSSALLGLEPSAWLGAPWTQRLHLDDREPAESLCRAIAADGEARVCVHRAVAADGEARWFRTLLHPARDGSSQICGVMLDFGEHMRATQQLQTREERLRLVVEQLPLVIYTTDRELRFTSGVGAALARLGLAQKRLPHVSVGEYLHTDDPEHPSLVAHRRALAGETVKFDLDWAGRTFSTQLEPFRAPSGEIIGVIAVSLDISDRKAAELERERLYEETRQALFARDEFLSVASHELRTPVTSLLLGLQSVDELRRGDSLRDIPDAHLERVIASANRQARRLAQLIDALLDVSRIQVGRLAISPHPTDLGQLARDVAQRQEPDRARAGCPLTVEAPHPVEGRWDRSRLDQVLTNLLSNAFKFAPGRPVRITVEGDPREARMAVHDDGIGIAPDRQAAIFDAFERAVSPRHFGGLGLGLYIAKRIVEAHDGRISVESAPDRGTTFTVTLPR